MKNRKWKELNSEVVLDAPFFKLRKGDYQRPDGSIVKDYYLIEKPSHVHIIALKDDGKVVLIRHYRPGTEEISIELPAGYIREGEVPEAASQRELAEETGYKAGNFLELCNFSQDTSRIIGYTGHFFLARSLTQVKIGELTGDSREEAAEIEGTVGISFEKAIRMVKKGEIKDVITIAGLLLAQRFLSSAAL